MIRRSVLAVMLAAVLWIGVSSPALYSSGAPEPSGRIVVGRSAHVSTDATQIPHAETFLALNPAEPRQMVAAAMTYDAGVSITAVYATQDGGLTWTRSASAPGVPSLKAGDPILEFDTTGAALFGGINLHPDGFRLWRSTDAGRTWSSVSRVPGGTFDRPYMAVDRFGGRGHVGRVHVGGMVPVRRGAAPVSPVIATTYSDDSGRTFAPNVLFDPMSAAQEAVGGIADLIVTRTGDVIVPFTTRSRIWTIVSQDGGRSFSLARPGPPFGPGSGYRESKTLGSRRAVLDTSPISPFVDRLYVSWIDFKDDRYDVKVAYSDDTGETWSEPVRVNDNTGVNDPANPGIAVNNDGVVVLTFNDRRDDPQNECFRLYAAASLDGGDTFLPNVALSQDTTCTRAEGNWPGMLSTRLEFNRATRQRFHVVHMAGVPERFPNGGETQGLAAGPDGRFHAAWINGQSGVTQVWYTEFRVEGAAQAQLTRDRTADIEVVAQESVTNFRERLLRFKVALRNTTTTAIRGPLTLRLEQLTGLNGLAVVDSDNGRSGEGAIWQFLGDAQSVLQPGALTEPQELRFTFQGGIPLEPPPLGRFEGRFRVLQASPP